MFLDQLATEVHEARARVLEGWLVRHARHGRALPEIFVQRVSLDTEGQCACGETLRMTTQVKLEEVVVEARTTR